MYDEDRISGLEHQAATELLRLFTRWIALLPGGIDPETDEAFSPLRSVLLRGRVTLQQVLGLSHLELALPPQPPSPSGAPVPPVALEAP